MTPQPIPSTGPPEALNANELADLRRQLAAGTYWVGPARIERLLANLDAARREARAQALAAVEEAVRGLPGVMDPLSGSAEYAPHVDRAAVLAVLAKLQEDEQ